MAAKPRLHAPADASAIDFDRTEAGRWFGAPWLDQPNCHGRIVDAHGELVVCMHLSAHYGNAPSRRMEEWCRLIVQAPRLYSALVMLRQHAPPELATAVDQLLESID